MAFRHCLFLTVDFASRGDRGHKRNPNRGLRLPVEFHHSQNQFVALFSLLQREKADAGIVDLDNGKLFPEASGVT